MRGVFALLYTFLFFSYVATGLFVVYHLFRYSLHRKWGFFAAVFFSSVLAILLITNAALFFTLPWDRLLPPDTIAPFAL